MQIAKPGLGRVVALGVVVFSPLRQVQLRWKVIAEMPDGVRKRPVLRNEQQQGTGEMKEGPLEQAHTLHQARSFASIAHGPRDFRGQAAQRPSESMTSAYTA
jgi:hypothetical protein